MEYSNNYFTNTVLVGKILYTKWAINKLLKHSNPDYDSSVLDQYRSVVEILPGINYVIDTEYCIAIYSKKKWDKFAEENSGKSLLDKSSIIGKTVLDFFAGDKVKEYYKSLYDSIFEGKRQEIMIKSKCDSPKILRDNVLFLAPVYQNPDKKDKIVGILHQSLIISIKEREYLPLLEHQDKKKDSDDFIEMCSVCKRVRYENEEEMGWITPEEYTNTVGNQEKNLEQSICTECSRILDEFL